METFILLVAKVLPLYLLIFLGFLAGRFVNVKKESVASILIYIIAPIVIFNSVLNTKVELNNLMLPVLFFFVACTVNLLFYAIAGIFWKDSNRNILAFTAGNGNTGYFGLPVAIALFGENIMGLVMLSVLGFSLYENSLGFYITAKGNFTSKQALFKLLKLPAIYACIVGITLSSLGVIPGEIFTTFATNFKGAYTVLGMMLIGLGISTLSEFKIDFKFTAIAFLAKFAVWPVLIGLVILIDKQFLNFWTNEIHGVMVLMSIVPLAANTVAFATELKAQPEKAAVTVLLSTIFALLFIPLVVGLVL